MAAGLPLITRTLNDMVEVWNHAGRAKRLSLVVEIDAPGIARAVGERLERAVQEAVARAGVLHTDDPRDVLPRDATAQPRDLAPLALGGHLVPLALARQRAGLARYYEEAQAAASSSSFTRKDEPQPQEATTFGFWTSKPAPIRLSV